MNEHPPAASSFAGLLCHCGGCRGLRSRFEAFQPSRRVSSRPGPAAVYIESLRSCWPPTTTSQIRFASSQRDRLRGRNGNSAAAQHASVSRVVVGPRGRGPPPAPRRAGRQSAARDRARGGVQLRPRRGERAGALGRDQGGVGGVRRGPDAVAHRRLQRARLARPVTRIPQPLLPLRRGVHRQPRPRHHGEVQRRRRERGDQRHGVLPAPAALALAERAHGQRPPVRHGAAPGPPERGEQGGGDRRALRGRAPRRRAAPQARALPEADRGPEGPRGAARRRRPTRRPRPRQRLLPLRRLAHHAALHRGRHLDHRQEGAFRVQGADGASPGSRARRHGEEREAGSGTERQGRQPLPAYPLQTLLSSIHTRLAASSQR